MKQLIADSQRASSWRPGRVMRLVVLCLLLVAAVTAWVFREPLRNSLRARAVLADDTPAEEELERVIEQAKDRPAGLLAFWKTGKIVPREAALHQLYRLIAPN